jgi:hypothetical protein
LLAGVTLFGYENYEQRQAAGTPRPAVVESLRVELLRAVLRPSRMVLRGAVVAATDRVSSREAGGKSKRVLV